MEYHKISIKDLSDLLQKRELSSLDLCNYFLDRIKRIDPKIKTCISVFEDEARKQAVLADERILAGDKSLLLGIPYLAKDNILCQGFKTTAASKMLENYIAPYDATVIKRLKESGAVLLGKANMDEFAHGSSTETSSFFISKNPWDVERVPGGSSGGSVAAVSAGLCVFALGSDTGGSIRQPASFCGVSGLKPSYSSVSRYGLMAMTSSTDVIGPIAKSAKDLSLIMNVIAGFDENDLSSFKQSIDYCQNIDNSLKGIKIGIVPEFIDSLEDSLAKIVKESISVFESLGAQIKNISLKYNKYAGPAYYIITPSEVSSNFARLDGIRYGFSFDYKAKGSNSENLNEIYLKNRGEAFGPEVKRRIMLGTYALSSGYYDAYYKKAIAVKNLIKKEFDGVFEEVDAILIPTSPDVAFKIGEQIDDPVKMYLEDIFTIGPSLAGLPGLSIPAGFSKDLPFGIQIISKKFRDDIVLNLANQFQSKTEFHQKFPNLN